MNYCHCCDEQPTKELVKCEGCNQNTCEKCCVGITLHNMIDFPFCNICEDMGSIED